MKKFLHGLLLSTLLLQGLSVVSAPEAKATIPTPSCADNKATFSSITSGAYTTVTFNASTLNLSKILNYSTATLNATCTWTAPAGVTFIEVLVVGGGGGGGLANQAGGGGAGGVLYNPTLGVTPGSEYTIKIGAGGSGGGESNKDHLQMCR